ncbi:MAG: hypothetical protein JWQ00_2059 [Noviherbaspirillum sp.]|nr:hypothetical protein [Noviherbaspirillum sp.]
MAGATEFVSVRMNAWRCRTRCRLALTERTPETKKGASNAPFILVAGLSGEASVAYLSGGCRVRISLDSLTVMVLQLGLVLQNLAVQFVYQRIDCRI